MERLAIQLAAGRDRSRRSRGSRLGTRGLGGKGYDQLALNTSRCLPPHATLLSEWPRRLPGWRHGIRQLRPHVVHSHNVRATALARLALLAAHHQAALVPTLHGVDPSDYRAASRVLSLTARRVIACAPAVARSLQAAGFPGDRIDVITNGAALLPADHRRQADLRQSLDLGQSASCRGDRATCRTEELAGIH